MNNTNNNIKNLLSVHSNALRCLHGTLNFDFCTPFNVYFISGKYTVRKIEKMIETDGYNIRNAVIAIVTRDLNSWNKDFSMVTVDFFNGIKIDYKMPYCNNYKSRLDTFFRKSDFEDVRKSEKAETYVFCQLKENLTKQTGNSIDYSGRFKFVNYRNYYDGRNTYIHKVNLRLTGGKGEKIEYQVDRYRMGGLETNDLNDIIDKSGYLVCERRKEWKRKAKSLRSQRAKAAFKVTDNTEKISKLEELINKRKNELVIMLNNATTSIEIRNMGSMINSWNGLYGVVRDFELLKKRDEEKSFSSITDFEMAYATIVNTLDKIKKFIEEREENPNGDN